MSLADEEDVIHTLHSELAKTTGDLAGLPEAQATELATMITRFLQERFGGREVYIRARDRKERDRAVVAAFTGANRDEVCKDFGISPATLYRILDRAR